MMFERLTRWENNDKDVADLIEEKSDFDGLTEAVNRLAEYEDSGLSPEEVQELAKAKADGRLVVLPCKVGELLQKYKELTEPQGDEAETYTTGYRNGHRNGQAELIAYLLQIDTGTREAAEKALEVEE